jgi:hypothetical protein
VKKTKDYVNGWKDFLKHVGFGKVVIHLLLRFLEKRVGLETGDFNTLEARLVGALSSVEDRPSIFRLAIEDTRELLETVNTQGSRVVGVKYHSGYIINEKKVVR